MIRNNIDDKVYVHTKYPYFNHEPSAKAHEVREVQQSPN